MVKFDVKRRVLGITALLMVTASLFGCSRDGSIVSDQSADAGRQQKNQAMGRYTEHEIPLPEEVTYDSFMGFQDGPEGKPVLFARKDNKGKAEFTGYVLSENMIWEEKDCRWLNRLGLPYDYSILNITYGEDGRLYAVYSETEDQDQIPRHHVVVTEDWENVSEIRIPALSEQNEMGYAYYPGNITALENGNLLFDSGSSLFLYDASGQQRITELFGVDYYYYASDNQFYVIDGDSASLILYDGADGKEKTRYPLDMDNYYGARVIADEDGNLGLISNGGIQILKNGSDIWEQIIEGKRNTMGSPKYYIAGFAEGGQEDYFAYFNSADETSKLVRYVYDPDLPVEPETELTIFSLNDNPTIRQAVSEFQIKNPNVKIDFQPLTDDGDAAIAEDYIRILNTELLAGGGPDILILDGMSETSYIEKGVLEDITDVIEPMVASGDFLANVADGCRVDERIYSVPVRMGLPLTFGRKEALKEAGRLDTLAGLVQSYDQGQIFGTMDRDAFLSLYGDAFLNNVVSNNGAIEEQELRYFLGNMKLVLDGSRISDGTGENRPSSVWRLLEDGTYLYSQQIAGFFDSGQGASVVEQAQGELEADVISINQSYVPYGTMGINSSSKNKEMAVLFMQTALSEEVQRSDFYDGFAVNQNALEFLSGIERGSADAYGGEIYGADGRIYEMKIGWPSRELRLKMVGFCKSARYSAGKNIKIKQILLENTKSYFDGTESLEAAMDGLMSRMTLYLQE